MIDKRLLQLILTDQKEELELKAKRRFVYRREEDLIDLDSPQAQVVIGVRRCGKSTLCLNKLKSAGVKFAYVNFDDERLSTLEGSDLNDVLETLYVINGDFPYLFIDEIQNIPEWYLFVNRLLRRDMHILITGSNAKLLSGELSTHLTGRHKPITLYPFSFAEFCEWKEVDTHSLSTFNIAMRRRAFDEYLRQGGFPELLTIKDHKDYIDGLVHNIVHRDIEQRFRISYKHAFEEMLQHILNVSPDIISEKNLSKTFKIKSEHTVANYIGYMEEAFLVSRLRKQSYRSRMRVHDEKVYPIDVALMNKRKEAFNGSNLGSRLETIVYIELLRRCLRQGHDLFYYTERYGECDFVVCKGEEVIAGIQVCYDISNPDTLSREIKGLLLAARKLNFSRLLLLTDHEYEDREVDGYNIAIRPFYEFALSDETL